MSPPLHAKLATSYFWNSTETETGYVQTLILTLRILGVLKLRLTDKRPESHAPTAQPAVALLPPCYTHPTSLVFECHTY